MYKCTLGARRGRAVYSIVAAVCVACDGSSPPIARRRATDAADHRLAAESTLQFTTYNDAATLRELLTTRAHLGRHVRVFGRCVRGPHALGQPPRANQWQLEADGVAMFVIGARPSECALAARTDTLTISALVAEDTLPAIGDLPSVPRPYLILLDPQPK